MGTDAPVRPATLDPDDYTVIPHVAVVDEFQMSLPGPTDDSDTEVFDVTPEFLTACCENNNRREAETGDLCPLVIGRHTKKDAPEKSQPDIVGYARNWCPGPLFNTGRLAAFADFWVKKERLEEVKKYPRRSAEIWRGRAEIDPISLLGATTPHRDLGLLPVALDRTADEKPVRYITSRTLDMPTEDKDKGSDAKATPEAEDTNSLLRKMAAGFADMNAKLDQLMSGGTGGDGNKAVQGVAAGPQPGAGGDDVSDMTDEELDKWLAELEGGGAGGKPDAGKPTRKEDEPVKANAYPGGQNTFTPDERLTKLERDNAELRLQLERGELVKKMNEYIGRGIQIEDVDKEVALILAMSPEARPMLLERIEKQYRRAPITPGMLAAVAASDARGPTQLSREDSRRVEDLAIKDGLSYDAAHLKMFGRYPWEAPKK